MKNCPMLKKHCETPKTLLNDLAEETYFDGSAQSIHMPFTCTLCSYCDHVCPQEVSLKGAFYDLKTEIVDQVGFPSELGKTSLSFHQNLSFSRLFSTSFKQAPPKNQTIFIPGCSPSAYSPDIQARVYEYLNNHTSTLMYKTCCGNPTLSVGQTSKFEMFTSVVADEIRQMDPTEIIVLCMNCYNTFARLLPNIKIRTVWEFIEEHGLPYDFKSYASRSKRIPDFTLHDPCPTRAHDHIHDAVRNVLNAMGVPIKEYEKNRQNTVCCGSGAMLSLVSPELAESHKIDRATNAPTDHILTYCQECTESLNRMDKKTTHLLDLLFGDMASENYNGDFNQRRAGTLKKWLNRRVVKKKSETLLRLKLKRGL